MISGLIPGKAALWRPGNQGLPSPGPDAFEQWRTSTAACSGAHQCAVGVRSICVADRWVGRQGCDEYSPGRAPLQVIGYIASHFRKDKMSPAPGGVIHMWGRPLSRLQSTSGPSAYLEGSHPAALDTLHWLPGPPACVMAGCGGSARWETCHFWEQRAVDLVTQRNPFERDSSTPVGKDQALDHPYRETGGPPSVTRRAAAAAAKSSRTHPP